VFHAAEHFHEEALALLLEFGVDLNYRGEWGNTPLYFLLRYWEIREGERAEQGLRWLLEHGADPNVRCGVEQENSLHMAARQGQRLATVRLLLQHGADVHARRGDGRPAWVLARRGGYDEVAAVLEAAGAVPEPLSAPDLLLSSCARGDVEGARRLASPDVLSSVDPAEFRLLPEAADRGRIESMRAYLVAGFPVDSADEFGVTALHHACIDGDADVVRELLRHGADFRLRDRQHRATPLGWACYGADTSVRSDGKYADCVRALLEAGARPDPEAQLPEHAGVREVLRGFGA
jgi:ankyrin repeat protein